MPDLRKSVFDCVRAVSPPGVFNNPENILSLDSLLDKFGVPRPIPNSSLTLNIVLEILEHEAVVQEMYLDSEGVPTWSVGITQSAGIDPHKYKDHPASIEECLRAFVSVLQKRYLPEVMTAFIGYDLKEYELAGALSFHYNTGAIGRASWVELVKTGKRDDARESIMSWTKNKELISRRKSERDLFFDGRWASDGKVVVYKVLKPSYHPDWKSAKTIDVRETLKNFLQET